ncbi:MAG: RsfS/YbeB/iojap family protein [Actinomycetota bacterium]|nr:RsfS/YbeB/iojap family protein [Actinomycetota bacterium]
MLFHVFDKKEREYYQLERLWSDRPLAPFPFDQDADLR